MRTLKNMFIRYLLLNFTVFNTVNYHFAYTRLKIIIYIFGTFNFIIFEPLIRKIRLTAFLCLSLTASSTFDSGSTKNYVVYYASKKTRTIVTNETAFGVAASAV